MIEPPEDILPPATREEAEEHVRKFREKGWSGQITIVLHFQRGAQRSSDIGMHRFKVDPTASKPR